MVYCKLSPNTKRRTCSLTKLSSENSSECEYNSQAKKCYTKKGTKKNVVPPPPPLMHQPPIPQPQIPHPPLQPAIISNPNPNPNPNRPGTSTPRYCKLSNKPGAKKRSCTPTFNANEDSKDCRYDNVAKKCYVNNGANKQKKQPQVPVPAQVPQPPAPAPAPKPPSHVPVHVPVQQQPQPPVVVNPNPNQPGPSCPRYCKLDNKPGAKRRSCTPTYNANEDSKECRYNTVSKKCFVNTGSKKQKPVPAPPVAADSSMISQNNIQINSLISIKNKTEFKRWINKVNTDKSFKIDRKKPIGGSTPILNPTSIKNVLRKDVPDSAISLVTYMPYNEDDDYKRIKFYKLDTCKNCSNDGIFAKNDIDNMLEHGYNSCPLCKELYNLSNIPNKPPFGTMTYTTYKSGSIEWHSLFFNLNHESHRRTQHAYYPKCEEGDLALWLICEAWKMGRLFTMGTSVTNGNYGIVFGGIHLRTSTSYGITNHGYSSNPKQDMKKIITNLINECNAFNIFTPSQLDDFAGVTPNDTSSTLSQGKAAKLIKELLLRRQIDKSDLRKQHKHRLMTLPRMDYFMVQTYPTGFLSNLIPYRSSDWKKTTDDILTNRKARVNLNKHRANELKIMYSNASMRTDMRIDMKPIQEKDLPKNFVPEYIQNLSKIIREFPRATKPFYVYRGAYIYNKGQVVPHVSVNPMPFSTSLNAWMALNFAGLRKNDCCLYRIRVDQNVPGIILGDTLFDTLKEDNKVAGHFDLNKHKGHLSKHIQYEVLLAPGILREKSRKIAYKITDKNEFDRLNETLKYKGITKIFPPYTMKNTGVLMIDVEYTPLYPVTVTNSNYEYDISM